MGLEATISAVWVEMEKFHYGSPESPDRDSRMRHLDLAYRFATDALGQLSQIHGAIPARAFEEIDCAIRAARNDLEAVVMKTRPIDLDLHDDFFEKVEHFAQAFLCNHKEALRRARGWVEARAESSPTPVKWITCAEAAKRVHAHFGDTWTAETCRKEITLRGNKGEIVTNGERNKSRRVSADSVDSLILSLQSREAERAEEREKGVKTMAELRNKNRR